MATRPLPVCHIFVVFMIVYEDIHRYMTGQEYSLARYQCFYDKIWYFFLYNTKRHYYNSKYIVLLFIFKLYSYKE
ncbi:hypothetical protein KUTeg_012217 [Tegillarca granosa]|uniref:Secreted protein n=1 Tax=Tegillarca granosa TaxID=220873 RepID=A0ABQ9F259_TEGGR|nr:hypothetical protein KUTeg_012217 [Tegillarca granosa]